MSYDELFVFVFSIYYSFKIFSSWYSAINNLWPRERSGLARVVLRLLPFLAFVGIVYVLVALASFDVVGSFIYILFYIFLGFAWIGLSIKFMHKFFDLSWWDDALERDNKAALVAFSGGFIGTTLIYAGANVGDGPGWWCVIFAGGLGITTFFILPLLINTWTSVFDQITVERNTSTGIRMGLYFIAMGILLSRAVAGDWTSFSATVVEFFDGWPVVILTLLALIMELVFKSSGTKEVDDPRRDLSGVAVLVGVLYVALALLFIYVIPPLRENPLYGLGIGWNRW